MKILTTEQIRSADAYTITHEPIPSLQLMERASEVFVETFVKLPIEKSPVVVVCGQGNNGGDGLAIARLLKDKNYLVQVWIVKLSETYSADCQENLKKWLALGSVTEIDHLDQLHQLKPKGVVIDAIFGSGISRGISGLAGEVVAHINALECSVVAVDMPSGLFADGPNPNGVIVEADYTLSFQTPKLAFLLPQNQKYVGSWHLLDIGLDSEYIDQLPSSLQLSDSQTILKYGRPVDKFAHKGLFGHGLLVSGSKGKIGAAVLSAKAALRSGLGLLTIHVPACGYQVVQTAIPEAMCQVDEQTDIISEVLLDRNFSHIGIGPGIGTAKQTAKALEKILSHTKQPMVIDADGLNILGEHREYLELLPRNTILTPHPKEFQRLAGKPKNDYHRLELQQELARKLQVIVICKGAYSTVALPDGRLTFNNTGNPGMATAGSGDVLTGIILGLLNRTGDPELAAVVGTYLHGLAGDLAAAQSSYPAMIASDLVENIGGAIKSLNLPL
jgi:NAD(P)H-hydrate epimerase